MLKQQSNIDQPHGNTCSWIFHLDSYKEWEDGSRGLLWIKGKPGAGKSTLMLHLYRMRRRRHLTNHELNLDFFFTARGVELQRTPSGMLRSLLNQLFRQDVSIRPAIRDVYEEKCIAFGHDDRSWEWQRPELEQLLAEAIVNSALSQQITIFIDALDEIGVRYAEEIVRYLHQIYDRAAAIDAKLKLCVASRHYPVVSTAKGSEVWVEQHNGDDINNWIHDYLDLDARKMQDGDFDQSMWHQLKQELAKQARGVFQWVRLVTPKIMKDIHDGTSLEVATDKLANSPEELGDIYAYIIHNVIDRQFRAQSFLFFQWVCFAERPLSVTEMRYALAAHHTRSCFRQIQCHETPGYIKSDEIMERRLKALSGGLVELVHDPVSSVFAISVIHQSVKEFFISKGLRLLARLLNEDGVDTFTPLTADTSQTLLMNHCHAVLYWCCLNYFAVERLRAIELAWERVQTFPDEIKLIRKDLASSLPFTKYAALFMFVHAEQASDVRSKSIPQELLLLEQLFPFWSKASSIFQESSSRRLDVQQNLLHAAAGADMVDMVMHLLKDGSSVKYEIHQRDKDGYTPLHHASARGHERTCDVLIQAGADISKPSRLGMTPIILAASKGYLQLVRSLLNNGADVNDAVPSDVLQGVGPLYAAAIRGHTAVVRVLIEAGADVNQERGYGTPLQAAIFRKKDKIVQMLLDAGADPKPGEIGMKSALHTAAEHGTESVLRLLLHAGVDVNARAGIYSTALQAAAVSGQEEVVQILLGAGADVNAQGGVFGTALQAAAASGRDAILQTLLNAGADMSIEGGKFGCVLRAAAYCGHTKTVKTLLAAGVDINIQSSDLGTALHAAATSSTKRMVRLLLDSGADPNIRGGTFGTVLQVAAHAGSTKITQMLLDASVDVNAQGGQYHTALQAASFAGHTGVVQTLVDAGADPNITGGPYHTALQAAVARYGDSRSIVHILLHAGADVHLRGGEFGSALEAAKAYGVREVIELLVQAGADTRRENDRPAKKARVSNEH